MLLKLRENDRSDRGQAMVMVLGMILIMAVVITIIVSSTVFGAYFTTQTRASVESQAAADAGVDAIYAELSNGVCAPEVDRKDQIPAYEAKVQYRETETGPWIDDCPLAVEDTESFRVLSTGFAQKPGSGGYDRGDDTEVVAEWSRPETPPLFEEAIRGDTRVYFNSDTVVLAPTVDGDIYTEGNMTCASGMHIQGSVVATGSVTWTNSDCIIDGDLYVGEDLVYPVAPYHTPTVLGDTVILDSLVPNSSMSYGSFQYQNAGQMINTAGTIKTGGLIHAYCSYPGYANNSDWSGYTGWSGFQCPGGTGSRVEMRVPDLELPDPSPFVKFTLTSEPWDSWDARQWVDPSSPGNEVNGGNCRSRGSGGGHSEITITTNTRIDTTGECNEVVLGNYAGITFNLGADLVIFGDKITQNGNVTINSTDGEDHSIYFVVPAEDSFTGCVPPSQEGTLDTLIRFSSGNWVQDDKTAALFYTTEKLVVGRSNFELGGQLYSCSNQMANGLELTFRRVGEQSSDIQFGDYTVQYIRQG
ncbi:TadE/TadG family type IV pilus assembly protein [Demequina sediminicola]|uniref:TadE/TadG family type IV pilus assembly protein n=1 Tax=Demequina sediminicola TaxID=1095026 RepID=UPI000785B34B|nr:Tad domain-containing protein [Demequina sediminicola]